MAEWVPSAPTLPHDCPSKIQSPPPPPLPPLPTRSRSRSRPPPPPPPIHHSKRGPPFQPGTYVVQVPKEQIFRVPPSENAQIAEEYRRKMQNRERRCPSCLGCLVCFLSILLISIFILCLAIGIFFLVVRPCIPSFSVESLIAKKSPNNKAREYFNLYLWSHNPSLKMAYCYEAGGNASLTRKGKDMASGKTPGFCQPSVSSSIIKLEIEGSYANLPKETSLLLLLIQFPVRLKVGDMEVLSRRLDITCDVRLGALATANKTRSISQGCRSKLHWIRI